LRFGVQVVSILLFDSIAILTDWSIYGPDAIFSSDSGFFDFKNIKLTPEPIQKPHPPIWLGGFTQAALRP
jgi:alkanesulfonate monooxygenase SsuD/methylene tetrahydromethanopterin reductase-like flavin-dependent oxidoreductase (luciferase family)